MEPNECVKVLDEFLEEGIIRDEKGDFVEFTSPVYEALFPVLATYKSVVKEHGDLQ